MAAIKINLEKVFEEFKSKEKIKSKTIATKVWMSSNDKNDLNHDLKRMEEGGVHKEIKAKGDNKTKTFIKI